MTLPKVIIRGIAPNDWSAAVKVVATAHEHYRGAIDEKRKVKLDKRFNVHETNTGTLVVTYAK